MCKTLWMTFLILYCLMGIGVNFFHLLQEYDCRASVDSLLNPEDFGLSLRSKGVLLHSAATAQSTMDYSTMAVDEGVVNSPVTREPIPSRVNSPSPLWPRFRPNSPPLDLEESAPVKRTLYSGLRDDADNGSLTVCTYASFIQL